MEDVKDFCQGSVEITASAERGEVIYDSKNGLQARGESLVISERGASAERLGLDDEAVVECVQTLSKQFNIVE